jgi:pimeloyl-ACP methyl ester carboxylesterase
MLLHSKILGQGEPLLILHGYFGMGDNWKTLAKQFAKNFEVHLIDQRNHGRSFHTDDFSYELMVKDLLFYINHYQLGEGFGVNLIGHSMGGKITMLFAVTFPEMVKNLIVADISPKFVKPDHDFILKALNKIDFSIQKTRKEIEEVLKNYIDENGIRQFLLKNVYWKNKGELSFRFNLESLTENNDEIGIALPSFTNFNGNVLFLKGENSNYLLEEDMPLIEAHFPKAIIKTVKNAGHWLHAENPTDFYKYVMAFLIG